MRECRFCGADSGQTPYHAACWTEMERRVDGNECVKCREGVTRENSILCIDCAVNGQGAPYIGYPSDGV